MGPGDTIIRFREKIQGPRDQKIALSRGHAEIFLEQNCYCCGSLSQPEGTNPCLGSQSVSGIVSFIICAVNIQPDISSRLTSASGLGLWFYLTEKRSGSFLSHPCLCALCPPGLVLT